MGSSAINKLLARKRLAAGRKIAQEVSKTDKATTSRSSKNDGQAVFSQAVKTDKNKKKTKPEQHTTVQQKKKKPAIKRSLLKRKIAQKRKQKSPFKPGLIKISNIPFGFFEDELKSYFSQFGKVLDTLVIKHAKTFRIKNYAYVKFAHLEVAKIAAESMNNYLMFDKLLKCKTLNNVEGFDKLIAKRSKFVSTRVKHQKCVNAERTGKKQRELIQKKLYKIHKHEQALSEKGINFKCITLAD